MENNHSYNVAPASSTQMPYSPSLDRLSAEELRDLCHQQACIIAERDNINVRLQVLMLAIQATHNDVTAVDSSDIVGCATALFDFVQGKANGRSR